MSFIKYIADENHYKPFLALIASLLKKGVEVRLIRANDDGLKTR